jgi:hypothetical protein
MPGHEQNLSLWGYKFALSKYVVTSTRFVGAQVSAVEKKVVLNDAKFEVLVTVTTKNFDIWHVMFCSLI